MGRVRGARWARTKGPVRRRRRSRWGSVAVVGVLMVGAAACRPPRPQALGLEEFTNCDAMLTYVKNAALARVGPYGLGSPMYWRGPVTAPGPMPGGRPVDGGAATPPPSPTSPGPGVPDHSGTNVQEAGVDEPDIVKTDGRRLLSVINNQLLITDLTGATPRLAGKLALPYGAQLLLQGDHVLVISNQSYYMIDRPGPARPVSPIGGIMPPYRPYVPSTLLKLVDIADVDQPKVLNEVVVDGSFVDARLVGGRARLVISAGMRPLPWVYPTDGTEAGMRAAQRENEAVIRRTTAADWLPKVRAGTAENAPQSDLVACDDVAHPPTFSGFDTVSVLSLDLAKSVIDTAGTVAVKANAQNVYASTKNLVVATQVSTDLTYSGRMPPVGPMPPVKPEPVYEPKTALHTFDVSAAGPAAYRVSGAVDGAVRNQWSLSEHNGYLRVVSTLGTPCGGCNGEQSQLSVLRLGGTDLPVVGTVGGMGKGEAVKSVRFVGDRAYVVTFRQVDPFYVLDLRDPTRPVVAGELKVPGYSAYLHPVGDGQILGVGRDATPEGRVTGTKVSLYDVTNPANPTETRSLILPNAYTSVEHTAKAFLWWEPERLAAVPVATYGKFFGPDGRPVEDSGFTGVIGLNVNAGSMTERGRVTNEPAGPYTTPEIIRSVVVGDRLLTISYSGVRSSDLRSLAPRSWTAFPTEIMPPIGVDPVPTVPGGGRPAPTPPPDAPPPG
jgi:hypothetical protein